MVSLDQLQEYLERNLNDFAEEEFNKLLVNAHSFTSEILEKFFDLTHRLVGNRLVTQTSLTHIHTTDPIGIRKIYFELMEKYNFLLLQNEDNKLALLQIKFFLDAGKNFLKVWDFDEALKWLGNGFYFSQSWYSKLNTQTKISADLEQARVDIVHFINFSIHLATIRTQIKTKNFKLLNEYFKAALIDEICDFEKLLAEFKTYVGILYELEQTNIFQTIVGQFQFRSNHNSLQDIVKQFVVGGSNKKNKFFDASFYLESCRLHWQAAAAAIYKARSDLQQNNITITSYKTTVLTQIQLLYQEILKLLSAEADYAHCLVAAGSLSCGGFSPFSDTDLAIWIEDEQQKSQTHLPHFMYILQICLDLSNFYSKKSGINDFFIQGHSMDQSFSKLWQGKLQTQEKEEGWYLLDTPENMAKWVLKTVANKGSHYFSAARALLRPYVIYLQQGKSGNKETQNLMQHFNTTLFKLLEDNQKHQELSRVCYEHAYSKYSEASEKNKNSYIDMKKEYTVPLITWCLDVALYFLIKDENNSGLESDIEKILDHPRFPLSNFLKEALKEAWNFAYKLRIEKQFARRGGDTDLGEYVKPKGIRIERKIELLTGQEIPELDAEETLRLKYIKKFVIDPIYTHTLLWFDEIKTVKSEFDFLAKDIRKSCDSINPEDVLNYLSDFAKFLVLSDANEADIFHYYLEIPVKYRSKFLPDLQKELSRTKISENISLKIAQFEIEEIEKYIDRNSNTLTNEIKNLLAYITKILFEEFQVQDNNLDSLVQTAKKLEEAYLKLPDIDRCYFWDCILGCKSNYPELYNEIYKLLQDVMNEDGWRPRIAAREYEWLENLNKLFIEIKESEPEKNKVIVQLGDLSVLLKRPLELAEDKSYPIKTYQFDPHFYIELFNERGCPRVGDGEDGNEIKTTRHTVLPKKCNYDFPFCIKLLPENMPAEQFGFYLDAYMGGEGVPCGLPIKLIWKDDNGINHNFAAYLMEDVRYTPNKEQVLSLWETLQNCPKRLNQISKHSFTETYQRVLLSNPEDDKGDDYFLVPKKEDQIPIYSLKRVDNERLFHKDSESTGKKEKPLVKTIVNFLNPVYESDPFDKLMLQDSAKINNIAMLQGIGNKLQIQQKYLKALFNENDIRSHYEKDLFATKCELWNLRKTDHCLLTHMYTKNKLKEIHTRLDLMQGIIQIINFYDLPRPALLWLETVQPKLGDYYKAFFEDKKVGYVKERPGLALERFYAFAKRYELYQKEGPNFFTCQTGPKALQQTSGLMEAPRIETVLAAWQGKENSLQEFQNYFEQLKQEKILSFAILIKNMLEGAEITETGIRELDPRQQELLFKAFLFAIDKFNIEQLNQQTKIFSENIPFQRLYLGKFKSILTPYLLDEIINKTKDYLEVLDLEGCDGMAVGNIDQILKCPQLKILRLRNIKWMRTFYSFPVGTSNLTIDLKDCLQLQTLELINCSNLTNLTIIFHSIYQFLKILRIKDCWQLKQLNFKFKQSTQKKSSEFEQDIYSSGYDSETNTFKYDYEEPLIFYPGLGLLDLSGSINSLKNKKILIDEVFKSVSFYIDELQLSVKDINSDIDFAEYLLNFFEKLTKETQYSLIKVLTTVWSPHLQSKDSIQYSEAFDRLLKLKTQIIQQKLDAIVMYQFMIGVLIYNLQSEDEDLRQTVFNELLELKKQMYPFETNLQINYRVVEVLVFGGGSGYAVGKSCVLYRFVKGAYLPSTPSPSAGIDFGSKIIRIDNDEHRLRIKTFPGNTRDMGSPYIGLSDFPTVLILMYDVTNVRSFQEVPSLLAEIKDLALLCPLILVGNCVDLHEERQVSKEQGLKLSRQIGAVAFFECSAKTGENIDEMFHKAAQFAVAYREAITEANTNSDPTLEGKEERIFFVPEPLSILIAGDTGSGKSNILLRFSQHRFDPSLPVTLGVDFGLKNILIDGKNIKLHIWDTAGQKRFDESMYCREKGINLLVYDVTRRRTFKEIESRWIPMVKEYNAAPVILVGAQSDRDEHAISQEEGIELSKKIGAAAFFECSAKTGENIDLLFFTAAAIALIHISHKPFKFEYGNATRVNARSCYIAAQYKEYFETSPLSVEYLTPASSSDKSLSTLQSQPSSSSPTFFNHMFKDSPLSIPEDLSPLESLSKPEHVKLVIKALEKGNIQLFIDLGPYADFIKEQVIKRIVWENLDLKTQEKLLVAMQNTHFYSLHLANCQALTNELLKPLLVASPNLQELDVSGCQQLDALTFFNDIATCKRLIILNTSQITTWKEIKTNFSQGFLTKLLYGNNSELPFSCLRRLNISGCKQLVSFQFIEAPHLEFLDVQDCDNLKYFILKAPRLKTINLSTNNQLEKLELDSFNLTEMSLVHTNNLTQFVLNTPQLKIITLLIDLSLFKEANNQSLESFSKTFNLYPSWSAVLSQLFTCHKLKNINIVCSSSAITEYQKVIKQSVQQTVQQIQRGFEWKIRLLGPNGSGKTSCLERFTRNMFRKTQAATIGVSFESKTIEMMGKKIKLMVWDSFADERDTTEWTILPYFSGTKVILLFLDLTDINGVVRTKKCLENLRKHLPFLPPMILIGSKIDLTGDDNFVSRVINYEEGKQLSQEISAAAYVECSAKTGEGVEEAFRTATRIIYENYADELNQEEIVIEQAPQEAEISMIPSTVYLSNEQNDLILQSYLDFLKLYHLDEKIITVTSNNSTEQIDFLKLTPFFAKLQQLKENLLQGDTKEFLLIKDNLVKEAILSNLEFTSVRWLNKFQMQQLLAEMQNIPFKHLVLENYPSETGKNIQQLLTILKSSIASLHKLVIKGYRQSIKDALDIRLLLLLKRNQELLTEQWQKLINQLQSFPKLHELTLENLVLESIQLKPSTNFANLRQVKFFNLTTLNQLDLNLPSLESLDLSGCNNLEKLILRAPQLKKIDLGACIELKELVLEVENLEEITLTQIEKSLHFTLKAPHLTEATIVVSPYAYEEVVSSLETILEQLAACSTLKSIKIDYENCKIPPFYIFKTLIVGASDVGKTSFMNRFATGKFEIATTPTMGVNFEIKEIEVDKISCKLQIWDTAGSERSQTIVTSYYRDAHLFFILFDVTRSKSLETVHEQLALIEQFGQKNVPKVLVGTHLDLINRRVISYQQAKEFSEKHNIPYFECSAKENINVNEIFYTATEIALKHRAKIEKSISLQEYLKLFAKYKLDKKINSIVGAESDNNTEADDKSVNALEKALPKDEVEQLSDEFKKQSENSNQNNDNVSMLEPMNLSKDINIQELKKNRIVKGVKIIENELEEISVDDYIPLGLVLMGDIASGKTAAAERFATGYFNEQTHATIGLSWYSKKIKVEGAKYSLGLKDIEGYRERSHSLYSTFLKNTDVILLFFDVTNKASRVRQNIRNLVSNISGKLIVYPDPLLPIILVGAQIDKMEKQISYEEGKQLSSEIGAITYLECSAKYDINIDEVFVTAAKVAIKFKELELVNLALLQATFEDNEAAYPSSDSNSENLPETPLNFSTLSNFSSRFFSLKKSSLTTTVPALPQSNKTDYLNRLKDSLEIYRNLSSADEDFICFIESEISTIDQKDDPIRWLEVYNSILESEISNRPKKVC